MRLPSVALILLAALAGCSVGPAYRRPQVVAPAAWKTDPADAYWRPISPAHAPLEPDWWRSFADPQLDALEQQALADNQTLRVASAHYDQAVAALAAASAALAPEVGLAASVARAKISADRPQLNYAVPSQSTVQNDIRLGVSINYELDLFGRIRLAADAAGASAQQAADDLVNARLILTADLATAYVALRELDAESDVLKRSVALQEKALDYVTARHELGAVSGLDLLQQQAQLDATRIEAQLLLNRRAQYEHAIAALTGQPAPLFSLAPRLQTLNAPTLPLGVPSELLQRRPDIASAERAMAAANARIGVARTAYFPSLTLAPNIGWEATRFADMLSAPALAWSVGGAAAELLFDGGRRTARVDFSRADYVAAEARYRQTVLDAFQQVQDGVTGLALLDGALRQAHAAVADAQRLLDFANDRYGGGLAAFIDVISAQQRLLDSERKEVQIRGQQIALVVFLAKALGGGWNDPQLPQPEPAPVERDS
ncbi:efflux transporter outer membrane subunit [Paraherbaspirillum soli]|uniref:Efflux transporter outer membrane subunit n=1 Tax=Paraherbaspirillum soli TaxID=631222 RepID=A0ABW0M8H5_9BURK